MIKEIKYPHNILSFPEAVINKSDKDIKELNKILGEDFRSYVEEFFDFAYENIKPNSVNNYVTTWMNDHSWKNYAILNYKQYIFNRINAGHSMPSDKIKSLFPEISFVSLRSDNRMEVNSGSKTYNVLIDDEWMNKMFNEWFKIE